MTKNGLTLREFALLPQAVQLELLHQHGVYVGKRKMAACTVVLFQLHGFYAEVFYRYYRREILRIEISADAGILQPYLDQIKLKGLRDE